MKQLLLSLSLLLIACPLVYGQSYNYRYGDNRVIIQSQTGLTEPSSSYIGPGTLSKSAQGAQEAGPQVNPGLPKVNHGGFIGTPGDNMYGANPIHSVEQKRIVRRQQQIIYKQPQQTGHPYVPSGNIPSEYNDAVPQSQMQIDSRGTASYGQDNSATGSNSTQPPRRF